ncbi:MAG TPA: hypothetical protein VLV46_14215 [Gaiellaceae bacterium]|nr:hypothetical protein [Gaiellaceae bacterium]
MRFSWGIALLAVLALTGAGAGRAAPVRVTVIGDSVAEVLAQNPGPEQVLAQGFDLQLQTQACRKLIDPGCYSGSPPSVLDVVQSLGAQLGPIVVVDVGYNDTAPSYQAGIDQVMAALVAAGVQHVIWVTLIENQQTWADINQVIRGATGRWPQLTVADWAQDAAGQPWFNDDAHLNYDGTVALAAFLRPFLLSACGAACAPPPPPPPRFCGLARTANGFDFVSAVKGISCRRARSAVRDVERGAPGPWVCSRAVHASFELDCRTSGAEVQVLERSPVAAVRHGSTVTLANWSFRLHGSAVQGLTGHGRWETLVARPPYCVPDVPREALAALPLRPTTPAGGCYAPR